MRKFVLALLLLTGVVTTANLAFAGMWNDFPSGHEPVYHSSHVVPGTYAGLRTSFGPGDTTYIGYTPLHGNANNPWSLQASNAPTGAHRPPAAGCMWNWDPAGEAAAPAGAGGGAGGNNGYINGDSLQGWWPLAFSDRLEYGGDRGDYEIPATVIDNGNMVSYYPVHGRTFGVVGVWHRDGGTAAPGGANGVAWAPLGGSNSAWCGLRRHGDTQYSDNITGNAFNADAQIFTQHTRYTAAVATPKFPGYANGWDQMLYKNINLTGHTGDNLTINFKYATKLSTVQDILGWFDKDPLTVSSDGPPGDNNCAEGNLISSWPDLIGPADSFMVYIGTPTETTFQPFQSTCAAAVGRQNIYDPLRRWPDEVIEMNGAGQYAELLSVGGTTAATSASVTIPNSVLAPMLTGGNSKIRIMFRVKTNQTSSDESGGFNSTGLGAAQVDDVTYSSSGGASNPAGWGDFEASNSIDNTQSADNAWRSTGKPPSEATHVAKLGDPGVPYDDICGTETTVGRVCSMSNGVLTFGFADQGGAIGDPTPFTFNHDVVMAAISPTIQLCSNPGNVYPNNIGIKTPGTPGDAIGTADVMVDYELFCKSATFNAGPAATGILYRWLMQEYPQSNVNGGVQWGNVIRSFANYQSDAICFRSLPGITGQEGSGAALGMYKYSAALGQNPDTPDSLKIGWWMETLTWTTGVNAANPIGGLYVDNVSATVIDGNPLPVSAEIWNFWQDSFPFNEANVPAYAASFDTSSVLVKTGLNIGPGLGLDNFDVPGDSIVATGFGVNPMRLDVVFRILPGPGNYVQVGHPASGLAKVPTGGNPTTGAGRAAAVATANSSNFWESYLADDGPFGTSAGAGHPGGKWDPNHWNSVRADTAEFNIFAFQSAGIGGAPTNPNTFMGTIHESEMGIAPSNAIDTYPVSSHRSALGIPRHKCYLASPTANINDIDCVHAAGTTDGSTYDLTYVTSPGSGFDGSNTTVEGTKIIPDGLLTPGSHVEYFWRLAENGTTTMTGMMPDTTVVNPQLGERNNDAHRWQEFSVLPDRWKDTGYIHPLGLTTSSPACMLVVDDQDSNTGDEYGWVSVADSIGATTSQKWGAHNGWHAKGGSANYNNASDNYDRASRAGFIAEHGGSPGTTWDFYQIKGAEDTGPAAGIGARLGKSDPSNTQVNGKIEVCTPSLEQLKFFYKIIVWLDGNLNTPTFGPYGDNSEDDQQMMKNWLLSGSPAALNRALWITGDGFIEANENIPDNTKQPDFDLNYLGAGLASGKYGVYSGNVNKSTIDLKPANGSALDQDASANVNPIYGVRNTCTHTDDVLQVASGAVLSQTSVETFYEDPNPSDAVTYPSGIFKTFAAAKPWAALTDGFDILDVVNRFGSDSRGRLRYYNDVITRVFAGLCPNAGSPVVPLDVPNVGDGNVVADFVNLRNNPLSSGMAKIHFGLAKDDRVEVKIFDVGGRLVRTLADRQFTAGEHDLVWDGADNGGKPVQRGVYFTQVKYRGGFADAKKLTVLK